MVDDALLLLEGDVMLLVDHDEAEIGKRQKQRRTRADNDHRAFFGDLAPCGAAFGMAEIGMPFDRRGAEARMKAREKLRAERDLRQEHKSLPVTRERRRDGGKIDFPLARSGATIEEGNGKTARHRHLLQKSRRFPL